MTGSSSGGYNADLLKEIIPSLFACSGLFGFYALIVECATDWPVLITLHDVFPTFLLSLLLVCVSYMVIVFFYYARQHKAVGRENAKLWSWEVFGRSMLFPLSFCYVMDYFWNETYVNALIEGSMAVQQLSSITFAVLATSGAMFVGAMYMYVSEYISGE